MTRPNVEEERIFTGLRLSRGLAPSESAEWEQRGDAIERFVEAGLLETDGDVLRLRARGVLLSNEVFQEFVAA